MIRKFFSPTVSPRFLSTTTLSDMGYGGIINDEDMVNVKSNENMDVSTELIHRVYLFLISMNTQHYVTDIFIIIYPIILLIKC